MKRFFSALLFCAFLAASCGSETQPPEYVVDQLEYAVMDAERSISILYPVFSGTDDSQQLTDELHARSVAYMEQYLLYQNVSGAHYSYTIDSVEATYQSERLVSILCVGSFYTDGAPHPETIVYAFNVNPSDGTVYEFGDIIDDFDRVAGQFRDGGFTYLGGANSIFEDSRDSWNYADLIDGYSSLYGIYPPVFFTRDGDNVYLTLSIELVETLGGHAKFGVIAEEMQDALSDEIREILF